MAFNGDFTPVLAKHRKSFNLFDALAGRRGQHADRLASLVIPNTQRVANPGKQKGRLTRF